MCLYLGETSGEGGPSHVTGRLTCFEDFATIDQEEGSVCAVPYRAITSAVELGTSADERVKTLVDALKEEA